MITSINYEKYNNMTERQLLNSLLNARKKEAKIKDDFQKKIRDYNELIAFLKSKLKEKIDSKQYDFVRLEDTKIFQDYKRDFEAKSKEEQEALKNEVIAEMNADYNDEL